MSSLAQRLNEERKARLIRLGTIRAPQKMEPPKPAEVIAVPKVEKVEPRDFWFRFHDIEQIEGTPLIGEIKEAVCKYFKIEPRELIARRKTNDIVYPRQIVMYLSYKLTSQSLNGIARQLGGRDHTTILHGARKIERLVPLDWMVAFDVAHIEAML